MPPRAPVFGEGTQMWTPNDSMKAACFVTARKLGESGRRHRVDDYPSGFRRCLGNFHLRKGQITVHPQNSKYDIK